jgi:hypothetical protein
VFASLCGRRKPGVIASFSENIVAPRFSINVTVGFVGEAQFGFGFQNASQRATSLG